ncbi:MAG: hypothetical protein QOC81_496 [Thermoanaerobaculia bacterium]|jgi:predicted RNA-binding Zn-ribbon protein involved in translation (DUF1610 family)|nr:hypothetical protein [Thermoanaerobaculia bacterium]
MSAKFLGRITIAILYVLASPIYLVQWLLRARKAIARMPVLRSGFIDCPHCGFHNPLDILASCRRCGNTEFGSRLLCSVCKQLSKSFACDRCTATIKVL